MSGLSVAITEPTLLHWFETTAVPQAPGPLVLLQLHLCHRSHFPPCDSALSESRWWMVSFNLGPNFPWHFQVAVSIRARDTCVACQPPGHSASWITRSRACAHTADHLEASRWRDGTARAAAAPPSLGRSIPVQRSEAAQRPSQRAAPRPRSPLPRRAPCPPEGRTDGIDRRDLSGRSCLALPRAANPCAVFSQRAAPRPRSPGASEVFIFPANARQVKSQNIRCRCCACENRDHRIHVLEETAFVVSVRRKKQSYVRYFIALQKPFRNV